MSVHKSSPTLIDRLQARIRDLDTAANAAICCAAAGSLPTTGPAAIIPSHLHNLRIRLSALRADMDLLVAIAQAGKVPVSVITQSEGVSS